MDKCEYIKRLMETLQLEIENTFEALLEYREIIEDLRGIGEDTGSMEVDWDLQYMQYVHRRKDVLKWKSDMGL